jgi:hypothetical protein
VVNSPIQARNQRPTCDRQRPYSGHLCQGETPYIRYEGTLRVREIVSKAHTQHNSLKPYSGTHPKPLYKGIGPSRPSSITLGLQQPRGDSQSRTEHASIVLFSSTHEAHERSGGCEFNEATMSHLAGRKSRRSGGAIQRQLYTGSQATLEGECWDDIIGVTSSGSLILYIVFSPSRNHQSREVMLPLPYIFTNRSKSRVA